MLKENKEIATTFFNALTGSPDLYSIADMPQLIENIKSLVYDVSDEELNRKALVAAERLIEAWVETVIDETVLDYRMKF